MIILLLLAATLVTPQDPPSAHHLAPVPFINSDLSSERTIFLIESPDDGTEWILTPMGETTKLTLRADPYPSTAAPTVEAAIEVARERELRGDRFLAIAPGATASLLLENEDDLLRLEPRTRYECSWAEGTTGEAPPRLELSLRSAVDQTLVTTGSIANRDPEGHWKRTRATLEIPSDAGSQERGLLLCLHNPVESGEPLLVDNLTLARLTEDEDGTRALFNGRDLTGWLGSDGNTEDAFVVRDGAILCNPKATHGNNLFTEQTFEDFVLHFEFTVPPAGNNGIALRAPLTGDPAYAGFEAQVLDTIHPGYMNIAPWQSHASLYGIAPAKRGFQRPTGHWNQQTIRVEQRDVTIVLNGETILKTNLDAAVENGTLSGQEHPGLARTSGHIGFCGHGHPVTFRNIRIKTLDPES
ncbi:MAG: DUF1080 domain-containing protein [Planctomycetota bacterium]|nr:DUF1080 domain-containing protein [Planctomycetota bacterium]